MLLKTTNGRIGAMLRIEDCPERLRENLLAHFSFVNPDWEAAKRYSPWGRDPVRIPKFVEMAFEKNGVLHVPRGIEPEIVLGERSLKIWSRIAWRQETVTAPVTYPSLLVALNKEQRRMFRRFRECVVSKARPFGNYLFVAPTGVGKAIFQAMMAKETGQRTLVLFTTESVRKVWFDELYKAFGLTVQDVGLIQAGCWRVGRHFTLASVQTLARRKPRWLELFNQIGTLVCDETHVITAPNYHDFVLNCPARFLLGATATDRDEGRKDFYLHACFGMPVMRLLGQSQATATSLPLSEVVEIPTAFTYEYSPLELDYHDLQEHLMMDEERNALIVRHVVADWKKGHSVLLATTRLAHVHLLADMLREARVDDVNLLTGETNTNRVYTEKLVEQVCDRKVRCVVATAQAVMLGANLNPMDRLHLAMPLRKKRNLEQLIGRIRRKAQDKDDCQLTYYVDRNVRYLFNTFKDKAIPVFRKLRVERFLNRFVA